MEVLLATAGRLDLLWAGGFRLFLVRDRRVVAETPAHVVLRDEIGGPAQRLLRDLAAVPAVPVQLLSMRPT